MPCACYTYFFTNVKSGASYLPTFLREKCCTHSCRACSSSIAIRRSLISACSFSTVTSSLCTKTWPSTITLGAGGRTAGGVLGRSGLVFIGIKCSATCSVSSECQLHETANTSFPTDELVAQLYSLVAQGNMCYKPLANPVCGTSEVILLALAVQRHPEIGKYHRSHRHVSFATFPLQCFRK